MSRYGEKVARRARAALCRPKEPDDEFAVIPDYALRLYFRARAGMYGLTRRTDRDLRLDVTPYQFGRLLHKRWVKLFLPVTLDTAVAAGELAREARSAPQRVDVYSTPYGGRMKAVVQRVEETNSPAVTQAYLTLVAAGIPPGRHVTREWRARGHHVVASRI